MKMAKKLYAITMVLSCGLAATLKAQNIYVTIGNGTLGGYTTSGATVNASLISGLGYPGAPGLDGVAVSGNDLFLANYAGGGSGAGFVGEYATSGATVNASLITGLTAAYDIAISGDDLFVVNEGVGHGTGTHRRVPDFRVGCAFFHCNFRERLVCREQWRRWLHRRIRAGRLNGQCFAGLEFGSRHVWHRSYSRAAQRSAGGRERGSVSVAPSQIVCPV